MRLCKCFRPLSNRGEYCCRQCRNGEIGWHSAACTERLLKHERASRGTWDHP